jgi:hypothetical protein
MAPIAAIGADSTLGIGPAAPLLARNSNHDGI